MSEQALSSNCGMSECLPEQSSWCRNEQVCQGVNCKVDPARYTFTFLQCPKLQNIQCTLYLYICRKDVMKICLVCYRARNIGNENTIPIATMAKSNQR